MASPQLNDDGLTIREIPHVSTVALRHSILWPNNPPSFVVLPEDALPCSTHLGAFLSSSSSALSVPPSTASSSPNYSPDDPVSVITLVQEPPTSLFPTSICFRKFATAAHLQGRGIGTRVLERVWEIARERGVRRVWCRARKNQEGWYNRRGLVREEGVEEWMKEGVAFVQLVRWLS